MQCFTDGTKLDEHPKSCDLSHAIARECEWQLRKTLIDSLLRVLDTPRANLLPGVARILRQTLHSCDQETHSAGCRTQPAGSGRSPNSREREAVISFPAISPSYGQTRRHSPLLLELMDRRYSGQADRACSQSSRAKLLPIWSPSRTNPAQKAQPHGLF